MTASLPDDYDSLSLEVLEHIDQQCDRYRVDSQNLRWPKIEDYVGESQEPEKGHLLRDLLITEMAQRHKHGETPVIGDYLGRFPQHEILVSETVVYFDETKRIAATPTPNRSASPDTSLTDIRRYEPQDLLGKGSAGEVHLAIDSLLHRKVALKLMRPDCNIDEEMFFQEARIASSLSHKNIAAVYDAGRQLCGTPFIVMQYIHGEDLRNLLTSGKTFSMDACVALISQVADALVHAHDHGLTHRDIKPANLLIDKAGQLFLTDFGFALHESVQHRHRGDRSGSIYYRAPEQVRGQTDWIDGRTDIWAVGVILYELLTGRRPFQGPTATEIDKQILGRAPRPPAQINKLVPDWLEEICLQCLSKDPQERFTTARALANALSAGGQDPRQNTVSVLDGVDQTIVATASGRVDIARQPNSSDSPGTPIPSLAENPYRGLRSFTEYDAAIFFGREDLTGHLWDALCELKTRSAVNRSVARLLPVIGPSGSGKSSLVRAGLIAELARRPLPGHHRIGVVSLTPGSRPIESLAAALARTISTNTKTHSNSNLAKGSFNLELTRSLEQELEISDGDDHDGLRRIVNVYQHAFDGPLLLLIDQFEELYSLCSNSAERDHFTGLLLAAAKDPGRQVFVLITLRSDFLGATQQHADLNRLVSEHQVLVPAMSNEDRRRAIELPAKSRGYEFPSALVDLLLQQAEGTEATLPLLQFTLHRLWPRVVDGEQPTHVLRELGGVGGALAGEAERVYEGLDERDQTVARHAFLQMIELGEGTRDTRRRVEVTSLGTDRVSQQRTHAVISQFATPETRLVTLSADANGNGTAEITHEALLDHWPTLQTWLDEDRDDLRFQRRVDQATQHWHQQGRPHGLLWRTPDLDLLLDFYGRAGDRLTQRQMEFRDAAEQQRMAEHRAHRLRRRIYKASSIAILVLACLAGLLGFWKYKADVKAANAEIETIKENQLRRDAQHEADLAKAESDSLFGTFLDETDQIQGLPSQESQELRRTWTQALAQHLESRRTDRRDPILQAEIKRRIAAFDLDEARQDLARDQYQNCIDLLTAIDPTAEGAPDRWMVLYQLARTEDGLGQVCRDANDPQQAETHFQAAMQYLKEWQALDVRGDLADQNAARSLIQLGELSQLDPARANETLSYFQQAIELRKKGFEANPNLTRQTEFAGALGNLGKTYVQLGELKTAISYFTQSTTLMQDALNKWQREPGFQDEFRWQQNIALTLQELSDALLLDSQLDDAGERSKQVISILQPLLDANPQQRGRIETTLWRAYYTLGNVRLPVEPKEAARLFSLATQLDVARDRKMLALARTHRRTEAASIAKRLIEDARGRAPYHYVAGCGYAVCAWSAREQGDDAKFKTYAALAINEITAAIDTGHPTTELNTNPELDALRELPEFQRLLTNS